MDPHINQNSLRFFKKFLSCSRLSRIREVEKNTERKWRPHLQEASRVGRMCLNKSDLLGHRSLPSQCWALWKDTEIVPAWNVPIKYQTKSLVQAFRCRIGFSSYAMSTTFILSCYFILFQILHANQQNNWVFSSVQRHKDRASYDLLFNTCWN